VPEAWQVVELLDRIANRAPDGTGAGPGCACGRARGDARGGRARSADLALHVAARCAGEDSDHRTVAVHGDFYDGQLLAEDGRLTGIVDADGAGAGTPATIRRTCSRTSPSWTCSRRTGRRHARGTVRWRSRCGTARAPADVARRTAAHLVGLATWPHAVHADGWPARTQEISSWRRARCRTDGRLGRHAGDGWARLGNGRQAGPP
jgi:aminoglycoside phosphotransferase (APT) family kinase protein